MKEFDPLLALLAVLMSPPLIGHLVGRWQKRKKASPKIHRDGKTTRHGLERAAVGFGKTV